MINRDDAIFVLVDVQGKLAGLMHKRDRLFRNLQNLIQGIKILDIPIIWAEQYPEGLGETVPEIKKHLEGYEPIAKKTFSVCRHPQLWEKVEGTGRREAIVAGIETHVCVYQTVADFLSRGYGVTVIADAVSSRTKENKKLGLQKMVSEGAKLSSVEMILFELLQNAEGDEFKQISKIIK